MIPKFAKRRQFLPLAVALLLAGACQPHATAAPTRVESGLAYRTGEPEFDAFFSAFHQAQTTLNRAPDEERALRRAFSEKLELAAGSTAPFLIDTVTTKAKELLAKKTSIELVVEGLGAEDEADTLVQSRVEGQLVPADRVFVEAATLLAREQVRLAARLRGLGRTLERLTIQAQALEPSLESSFSAQGYAKYDEARRNLASAARALPLMQLKTRETTEGLTEFVRKLQVALATNREAKPKAEIPLVTVQSPDDSAKSARPARARGGRAAPSAPAKPRPKNDAGNGQSGDFDP